MTTKRKSKVQVVRQPKQQIGAQKGPQTDFLASNADIVIYGGAAGAGKSFALLMECLRHVANPQYRAIVFRRTSPEIRNPGGLLDESRKLYGHPFLRASLNQSELLWTFPSGAQIKLASLQYESDLANYQGSQFDLLCIDEASHFKMNEVLYLMSRNRSVSGIQPYVRMTTNPDPDSWLRQFLDWWIDDLTGLPIKSRSGKVRYFVNTGDNIVWGEPTKLKEKYPQYRPKSCSFISANIYDNRILLTKNPDYLSNLQALSYVEREKLLHGNWNVRPAAGKVFNRGWFDIVEAGPTDVVGRVRAWDKAGTENAGDYTVGLLLSKTKGGFYFVEDVVRGQWSAAKREEIIRQTAERDGTSVGIVIEQEPGSGGKDSAYATVTNLSGYKVHAKTATGSKLNRAEPAAAQAEVKNIKVVKESWNEVFLKELHHFPEGKHDDQVDALSMAFNELSQRKGFFIL